MSIRHTWIIAIGYQIVQIYWIELNNFRDGIFFLLNHNKFKLKQINSKHEPLVLTVCIFVKLQLLMNAGVILKILQSLIWREIRFVLL